MSYIAFELDAFDSAEAVARHAGADPDRVMAGLLRLWRYCWRQKTDRVSADQLRGVFGLDVGPALVAFGFVAPVPSGEFRVKGADRYLRVQEGRSKGGRAAAANGNLKNVRPQLASAGLKLPISSPSAGPSAEADAEPQAFSEQRAATSEYKKLPAPREKRAPPPRETDGILEDFAAAGLGAYRWQGAKDSNAWKAMRSHSSADEIRATWRFGLAQDGWLRIATVAQLGAKWNDLRAAMARPDTPRKGAAWTQGAADTGKGFLEGLSDGL